MNLRTIIKRPVITEKSLGITKDNKFTFEVDRNATKTQIKQAVKQLFGVDAVSVSTLIKKSITTTTGKKRLPSKSPIIKKAIVRIKQGQSIKIFETKG